MPTNKNIIAKVGPKGASLSLGERVEFKFPCVVTGTDDYNTAYTAIISVSAGTFDYYPCTRIDIAQTQPFCWNGFVTYGTPEYSNNNVGGDILYQFETTGETGIMTHSISNVSRTANLKTPPTGLKWTDSNGDSQPVLPGVAPDNQGAIGVDESGAAQGCTITLRTYNWTETHYFSAQSVTAAFRQNLFFATGTVNNYAFGDNKAFEVLFLGCTGQRRSGANGPDWEISFRFSSSPNCTQANALLNVAPFGVVTKNGWDYFWIQHIPYVTTSGIPASWPVGLYIEQVYAPYNFGSLGIPTGPYVPGAPSLVP